MKKIKVVEFFGEPLNYGGQEAFILNVYSKIDKSKFDFSFITPFDCQNKLLKKTINDNNDELIFDNKEFNSKMRKKFIIETAKKYLNDKYDVIHIHSGSVFTLYNVAKIAKKKGIKKVIVHSHASGVSTLKYKLIKLVSDLNITKYVDYYMACSRDAGIWKFPKKVIDSDKFFVIKNGIDIKKFEYNKKNRDEYRKEYDLEKKNIICTIGRFAEEKNPLYTLRVFKEYLKLDENGYLLMIGGSGDQEKDVESFINDNKLEKNVLILKNRDDINCFLSMSDIYIMPSLWEGLGMAAIEAQTSGMNVLCSDNIPEDVNISSLFHRLSLSEGEENWAKEIKKLINSKRENVSKSIIESGFDVSDSSKKVEDIYLK